MEDSFQHKKEYNGTSHVAIAKTIHLVKIMKLIFGKAL